MTAIVTDYIALEWYDGPLLEVARVDFVDRDSPKPMVQVCALCTVKAIEGPPSAGLRAAVSGDEPWTRATIRLTREDLVKMLDLIDGKAIEDWNGDLQPAVRR